LRLASFLYRFTQPFGLSLGESDSDQDVAGFCLWDLWSAWFSWHKLFDVLQKYFLQQGYIRYTFIAS
jgi:hypothetical protein